MELNGVSLRYHRGAPWVLRGVSAAIGPGEAVLVTGRNGAGKSTLLRVLAGLLPTSRGTVDNRPPEVGYVPERFPVRQPFTARAYLEATGRVRGMTKDEARRRTEHWAERLNMREHLGTRLGELSKGTVQKVGIIQALLTPPTLLVLDEPWEGLDAQARDELPAIVGEVTDAGGFCIFSDHRGEAGDLPGVRRWVLDDGLLTEPEAVSAGRHIIEVVVPAAESAAAVARLRAAGHQVRAVRRERIRDLGGHGDPDGSQESPAEDGEALVDAPADEASDAEVPDAAPGDAALGGAGRGDAAPGAAGAGDAVEQRAVEPASADARDAADPDSAPVQQQAIGGKRAPKPRAKGVKTPIVRGARAKGQRGETAAAAPPADPPPADVPHAEQPRPEEHRPEERRAEVARIERAEVARADGGEPAGPVVPPGRTSNILRRLASRDEPDPVPVGEHPHGGPEGVA